jgi:hypothetical protein
MGIEEQKGRVVRERGRGDGKGERGKEREGMGTGGTGRGGTGRGGTGRAGKEIEIIRNEGEGEKGSEEGEGERGNWREVREDRMGRVGR